MTDIDYIRNGLKTYFESIPVAVNFLSKVDNSISLSTNGTIEAKKYISGAKVITKTYSLSTTKPFNQSVETQSNIYEFFDGVAGFIENELIANTWDANHIPVSVEVINSGYMQQQETTLAKWVLQFKFTFKEV